MIKIIMTSGKKIVAREMNVNTFNGSTYIEIVEEPHEGEVYVHAVPICLIRKVESN